jgi:hypothetical protein
VSFIIFLNDGVVYYFSQQNVKKAFFGNLPIVESFFLYISVDPDATAHILPRHDLE